MTDIVFAVCKKTGKRKQLTQAEYQRVLRDQPDIQIQRMETVEDIVNDIRSLDVDAIVNTVLAMCKAHPSMCASILEQLTESLHGLKEKIIGGEILAKHVRDEEKMDFERWYADIVSKHDSCARLIRELREIELNADAG